MPGVATGGSRKNIFLGGRSGHQGGDGLEARGEGSTNEGNKVCYWGLLSPGNGGREWEEAPGGCLIHRWV